MGIVSEKLRQSARGQNCTFQIPGICNHNPETTVLCHCPSEVKGMGNKSHDFCGAFGCSECHVALDQHRLSKVDELFYWLRGLQRTWEFWFNQRLIELAGDPQKSRPKRKANMPSRKIQSRPFYRKEA